MKRFLLMFLLLMLSALSQSILFAQEQKTINDDSQRQQSGVRESDDQDKAAKSPKQHPIPSATSPPAGESSVTPSTPPTTPSTNTSKPEVETAPTTPAPGVHKQGTSGQ